MSYNDDYAPRQRRDRPRYDQDDGLTYPDQDDYPKSSGARASRYETSPSKYPSDEPRRRRDVDPRDVEPRATDKKSAPPKYREYSDDRDDDMRTKKSNTGAPRRRTPPDDDERGDEAGYGRSKGYREPVPRSSDDPRARSSKPRNKDDYDDFDPAPPRRARTYAEPERRRREDPYDDPPRRRYRSPDDKYAERDRGYRSDERDGRRRRDDDRYDDKPRRSGGGGSSRRDDGYASAGAYKRSDRDRDRDRDRDYRSSRDRDRRYDSRDDRSRDRDRKGKKKAFSIDDIGGLVEQGQKHYKTVAPLVTSLAKMYMDSKK
ncbi:hypothetical protein LTR10_021632 [Elasticomyces elasticus]|uniref:Uncharacterized protein n=1 Tax=Exophiala sideris TaxID=1016849 RepID=A0ABR0J3N5_9EURO|nr:hypothetical protein LTR10_021632 [Elasticomyces elasticus]KAK5024124.1 hypothetical protein LTS07_008859 [Exophiala sideris]KAK5029016.1 hypothetical protein LTR13_008886 [Exophiala sideris]KAK5054836.1 hypothetical protein LTR69_008744 [Exophiala sideris]KAK5178839.1 hypothetical protein LTR44_008667 [Eurotiomycetes sp. CCFEE 6388]